jgi:hypothetical protein
MMPNAALQHSVSRRSITDSLDKWAPQAAFGKRRVHFRQRPRLRCRARLE